LGQVGDAAAVPVLLDALRTAPRDKVRTAALAALQAFSDPAIAETVVGLDPGFSSTVRGKAIGLLAARPGSAAVLLRAVDGGRLGPKELPLDHLRRMSAFKQPDIDRLISKHWGRIAPPTDGEKLAHIRH